MGYDQGGVLEAGAPPEKHGADHRKAQHELDGARADSSACGALGYLDVAPRSGNGMGPDQPHLTAVTRPGDDNRNRILTLRAKL